VSLTRRRFLTITSAACLASPAAARTQWSGRALGAGASIVLRGHNSDHALNAAKDTIRRMEKLFSLYDANSALSRLNRVGTLEMPPEFATLMGLVDKMHAATEGLFDPTIQPLWTALAKAGDIDAARRLIGWKDVRHDSGTISFEKSGMAMTLNGIAQGFATDRVKATLAAYGFDNVIVNIGEYAVGGEPATLGVADAKGAPIQVLELQNEAVATSSPRALRLSDNASHILHPRAHAPDPIWDTVSVVAPTATIADALSTALVVAPNMVLARALRQSGLARLIVLKERNAKASIL